jgi:hypothetical protein
MIKETTNYEERIKVVVDTVPLFDGTEPTIDVSCTLGHAIQDGKIIFIPKNNSFQFITIGRVHNRFVSIIQEGKYSIGITYIPEHALDDVIVRETSNIDIDTLEACYQFADLIIEKSDIDVLIIVPTEN